MTESQAQVVVDFIDGNWVAFELVSDERSEDPEAIRSELEKIAMGD